MAQLEAVHDKVEKSMTQLLMSAQHTQRPGDDVTFRRS
jgi:hypothetical protein